MIENLRVPDGRWTEGRGRNKGSPELQTRQRESGEQIPRLFQRGCLCGQDTVREDPTLTTEVLELISTMIPDREGRTEHLTVK